MPTPVIRRSFPRSFKRKKDRDLEITSSGPFLIIVFHYMKKTRLMCAMSQDMVCKIMPTVLLENLPPTFQTDPQEPGSQKSQGSACRVAKLLLRASSRTERLPSKLSGNPRSPAKLKHSRSLLAASTRSTLGKSTKNCLHPTLPELQESGHCLSPPFQTKHGIDFAECTALRCRPGSTIATRSCCVKILLLLRARTVRHRVPLLQIHQCGTLSGRADCRRTARSARLLTIRAMRQLDRNPSFGVNSSANREIYAAKSWHTSARSS